MAATITADQVTTDVWEASWAERAACRGVNLDCFFEDLQQHARGSDPYGKAKQVCNSCEPAVRRSCLATAIAEGLRSGFFGGTIPARRIELRKAAQKAGVDVSSARNISSFLAATGR